MKNSFKTLSVPELRVKREELVRKYLDFRFQLVVGHVDNPLQKRELRRQIARLNCMLRQHELTQEREAAIAKAQQLASADAKTQQASPAK